MYKSNGILPFDDGAPVSNGVLVERFDNPCKINGTMTGVLSAKDIDEIIEKVF